MNALRALPALAGGCALILAALQGTAAATPSSGVTGTILAKRTVNGTDYIVRELTIAPGGTTGWHFHDGAVRAVVRQGTLTHNLADCSLDGIYREGDVIREPAGADHVHVGRNLGTTPVVLDALYVIPHGSPLAEDAPNPGCDFQ
ncbi:cupin domain-containing protein [Actinomadura roseirufa]|uniref:cupin domain-containing protein n=1 Tax=Actinomadura roseirufa TaxID=2094049 RepID=UPI00104129FD|nr:cupin domain-containing protein [Actinomadura roseirufa]